MRAPEPEIRAAPNFGPIGSGASANAIQLRFDNGAADGFNIQGSVLQMALTGRGRKTSSDASGTAPLPHTAYEGATLRKSFGLKGMSTVSPSATAAPSSPRPNSPNTAFG